jgi:hypothetical protein
VLGVDTGAIAVVQVAVADTHRADRGREVEIEVHPTKRSRRFVVAMYDIIARPALTRVRRSVGVMGVNLDSPFTVLW